jgi:hippurate hydrolase
MHGTGSVINEPALSAQSAATLTAALGKDRVVLIPASEPGWTASEDFPNSPKVAGALGLFQHRRHQRGDGCAVQGARQAGAGEPFAVLRARSGDQHQDRGGNLTLATLMVAGT